MRGEDPERRGEALRADLVLLMLAAVWGTTFTLVKGALDRADPFTFLALRFALGGLLASALAGRRLLHGPSVRAGLVLSVVLFAGYALQTLGLRETAPSRSAFITGLSVALVPFAALLVFRRRPTRWAVLGVALSVAGLYLLVGEERGAANLRGDLLTLGCAVAYAFHYIFTERYARRSLITTMVAVQLWGVSVLSALCLPLVERRLEWSGGLVGALLLTGVVASALAIGLQSWAQARTTALHAALIVSMEPVFAALFSALAGGERPGLREVVGGGLIVLGVVVVEAGPLAWRRARRGRGALPAERHGPVPREHGGSLL